MSIDVRITSHAAAPHALDHRKLLQAFSRIFKVGEAGLTSALPLPGPTSTQSCPIIWRPETGSGLVLRFQLAAGEEREDVWRLSVPLCACSHRFTATDVQAACF